MGSNLRCLPALGVSCRSVSTAPAMRLALAGALGLSLTAGGGGDGGGSGPVAGAPPPVSGIGPTIPRFVGNGSSYEASVAASTVNPATGTSTFVQAPTDPATITFNLGRTDISAPFAGGTVSLRDTERVSTESFALGSIEAFQRPLTDPNFVAILARLDHVAFGSWIRADSPTAVAFGVTAGGIRTPGSEVPTGGHWRRMLGSATARCWARVTG